MWQDSTGKYKQRKITLFLLIVFYFGVWHILLLSNKLDFAPRDLQPQRVYCGSSWKAAPEDTKNNY